jgi:hypothetical protein
VRAERSTALPRLGEGGGAVRTSGAWRLTPGAGSSGEPMPWSAVGSCGEEGGKRVSHKAAPGAEVIIGKLGRRSISEENLLVGFRKVRR